MELTNKDYDHIEIIVIDDNHHNKMAINLRHAARQKKFVLPIKIEAFNEASVAVEHIEKTNWRYVKIIILDYELNEISNPTEEQELSKLKLINLIKEKNDSIDIWGVSAHDPLDEFQSDENFQLFRANVVQLIDKDDLINKDKVQHNFNRIFKESIEDKAETPFYNSFKEYVQLSSKSWHVPGHNRGQALSNSKYGKDFYDFFKENAFAADHDVPKNFGSIFGSEQGRDNVIAKTQNLVAKTFKTDHTFFVTNGNSASNNIILLSLLKPNDEVLVARSCHKSIHYAMVMSGAKPTYLNSTFSPKYEIIAPPSIIDIEASLESKKATGKHYKLVIITGCSYEGLVMDINRINILCKKYNTELFVDEAWYGYSNFHPLYQPTSATRLGVPYVTQSAHKMLSAFRQSAFIHINNPNFDFDFFKDIYNTFTSTSPQYQLIASMDVAAMQMRMEGYELVDKALDRADKFRKDLKDLKRIKVITKEDLANEFRKEGYDFKQESITYDPLKISLDISGLGLKISDVTSYIKEKGGVDLIKYTKNCVQLLFTIGTNADRNKTAQLADTLRRLEKQAIDNFPTYFPVDENVPLSLGKFEYKNLSPRDFFYGKRKLIPLEKAEGYFSSTLVTPYPPGIPILVPGEPVSLEHINYLKSIKKLNHVSVHGLKEDMIYVYAE